MKQALITRPEHDDTTHYLSHWAKKCIDFALTRGIKIFDLWRERANRKEVTSFLSKEKPEMVILNGHGSDSTVAGHRDEPIIAAGDNENLLKEKIIYAISCKSAKRLGPASIDAGARTYVGYDDDFVFVYDPNKITHPTDDKTAALFLEPSNELIISLLKGNTAEESHKRSQNLYRETLNRILSTIATEEYASLLRYIWWDMVHQKLLGDKSAACQ